jgi:type 1 glutamine amidotransferase
MGGKPRAMALRPFAHACAAVAVATIACGSSAGDRTSGPTPPGAAPSARLLVVTHTAGFRHDSIPVAESTLRDLGIEHALYQTEFCRTAEDVRQRLTPAGLASVDAVFFANTTGNLGIPDLKAFLDWLGAGRAFLGAHSASDTYHDEPAFLEMLGGEFRTHGSIAEADIRVDDPSHPAVGHLVPRFRIVDELYRFDRTSRASVHVLLSMDRVPPDGVGEAGAPADLPMAWTNSHGTGRVFYTALGHRQEVWRDERFRRHLVEAIRWAIAR